MTAERLLTAVEAALQPLVQAESGTLELASDLEDAHDRLRTGGDRWRMILTPLRGDDRDAHGRVETLTVLAALQARRTLSAVDKSRDVKPLLARLSQVRAWLLGMRFATPATPPAQPSLSHPEVDCAGFQSRSWYWLVDPDYPTRQVAAEFTIRYALDPITARVVPVAVQGTGAGLQLHGGGGVQLHGGGDLGLHA